MKPGDKVISDLDGKEYTVLKYDTRDSLEPLPRIKRLGSAIIGEDSEGQRVLLYDWEYELKKNESETK